MKAIVVALTFTLLFSWELKKEENGIKVYTEKTVGSSYDVFKAETVLKKPFDYVKRQLLDFKNYPKWQKKIIRIEKKGGYLLKVLDFPFPFGDRFAFYKIKTEKLNKGFVIDMKSVRLIKLPKNVKAEFDIPSGVEMDDNVSFMIKETEKGVYVVYTAHVDPKGVPAFIFNSKIIRAAYETLDNFKRLK